MGRSGWGCSGRRVGGDEGKWRKRLKKAYGIRHPHA